MHNYKQIPVYYLDTVIDTYTMFLPYYIYLEGSNYKLQTIDSIISHSLYYKEREMSLEKKNDDYGPFRYIYILLLHL